jgi:hypothetical protein
MQSKEYLKMQSNKEKNEHLPSIQLLGMVVNFLPYRDFRIVSHVCQSFWRACKQKHAWTHLQIGKQISNIWNERTMVDVLQRFEQRKCRLETLNIDDSEFSDELKSFERMWWENIQPIHLKRINLGSSRSRLAHVRLHPDMIHLEELDIFLCQLRNFPVSCQEKDDGKKLYFPNLHQLRILGCSSHLEEEGFPSALDLESAFNGLCPIRSGTCHLRTFTMSNASQSNVYTALKHLSGHAPVLEVLSLSIQEKKFQFEKNEFEGIGLDFPSLVGLGLQRVPWKFVALNQCHPMQSLKTLFWDDRSRGTSFQKLAMIRKLACHELDILKLDGIELWTVKKILDECPKLQQFDAGHIYAEAEGFHELGINLEVVYAILLRHIF